MDQLATGSVLAGRYRLAGPTGPARTLSLASVWRAIDELTRLEIAVKVLDAGDGGDPSCWTQACQVLAMLRCPGVAQVHDDGQVAVPGGGTPIRYLVRDLVPGQTLEERLAEGPLQAAEALRIVASLANTLAALHEAGLSHGNLVPSNVVLGPDGVTVTDAGLWLLRDHPVVEVFPSALSYTAPERLAGGPVTPAADMYSLGVVFAACLSGIAADGNDGVAPATSLLGQVLARSLMAGEPPAGDPASLLASCLGASPDDRPSAARAAMVTRQIAAGSASRAAQPASARSALASPAGRGPAGHGRSRRAGTLVGTAAGLLGAAAGLAGLIVVMTTRPPLPGPAAKPPAISAHVVVPPSASTGTTPGQGSPADASSSTPESSAPASSTPAATGTGPASRLTTIDELWGTVVQGSSDGQIRPDVATDMLNLIRPVRASLVAGRPDGVAGLVATLRAKLATRLSEGAITLAAASTIRAELDRLAASLG